MFHTVAYSVALGNTADTDMTAITDQIETIQNGHIVPQVDKGVLFAWAGAVTLIRAKITSPTIRQYSPVQIRPIDLAKSPTSRMPIADYRMNPLTLKAFEEIQVQATDSAAGPNNAYAVLGLSVGGIQPAPAGQVYTMRGTGTTAQVAGQWTGCAITWADTLPQGQFVCVGMSGIAATGVAARLTFDQQAMRPGGLIGAADTTIPWGGFLKGGLGVWGSFNSFRMPTVEFLSDAADGAQEIFIDFVRVA